MNTFTTENTEITEKTASLFNDEEASSVISVSLGVPRIPVATVASPRVDNVPFTPDERAVWNLIQNRVGKEHAISIGAIEILTHFGTRRVKATKEDLIRRHGLKIGSSRGKPHGYYVIENAAELLETARTMRNQGINMLICAASLEGRDGKAYLRELLGQMVMEEVVSGR